MIKKNKTAIYLLLIVAACVAFESCATSNKGCGCGGNLNKVYKQPKRYH